MLGTPRGDRSAATFRREVGSKGEDELVSGFVDDVTGSDRSDFDTSVRSLARRLFPTRQLSPVPRDHSLYRAFFLIDLRRQVGAPSEPDHDLVWLTVAEAMTRLRDENHRWALARAVAVKRAEPTGR